MQAPSQLRFDELYERHWKPLEAEHWDEFLVVSPRDEVLLAPTLREATKQAAERFGRGVVVYKVGERSVGRI
jgi:hypothetical protein